MLQTLRSFVAASVERAQILANIKTITRLPFSVIGEAATREDRRRKQTAEGYDKYVFTRNVLRDLLDK